MYADPAGIFLTENPIFQKKNAVLADFAAGLSLIIKQNLSGSCLEGGPVPLRPLLRSRRLSCNYRLFFAFIFANTAVGRPYRVMKPSDQVWSYTSSSSKVAISGSYRL